MNSQTRPTGNDEIRPEYDFSGGVRRKHYKAYRAGTNVVFLDPDIAEVFTDSAAVNQALRQLVKLARAHVPTTSRPNPYQPSPRQGHRSSPSGRRVKKTRDRKR